MELISFCMLNIKLVWVVITPEGADAGAGVCRSGFGPGGISFSMLL